MSPSNGLLTVCSAAALLTLSSVGRATPPSEGGESEVAPDARPPQEAPSRENTAAQNERTATTAPPRGPSPLWFFVAGAVTVTAGGFAAWSALDTQAKHKEFERDRSNDALGRSGEAAALRTDLLLGLTAALAVTTAAVGIFVIRWDQHNRVVLNASASRVALSLSFR